MKTKQIYRLLSKRFEETDFTNPPSYLYSKEDEKYVKPNEMKKSKDLLYTTCSESDSIVFLIQTISKNIIFHIQNSNPELFIHFFQYKLSWMERGAIQKIFIFHSSFQSNSSQNSIDDYVEYLLEQYQFPKIIYLGSISNDIWIGLCDKGLFCQSISKL